ncbi:MAG: AAA family ATPase [Deltaproteobacteria bacterium]|jgi:chromosome segregation protein|nr:AAA family ATPase [Deltaproteobacteria bacterium]
MYLKRLEIVGFKSFTERAIVPFSPGVSAVVGPNGCGKSNIIDAIRWVMGEQSPKLLRARAMEDLLFNGSRGRPPAALAEVTLTLEREREGLGAAEVAVTRRLYRGGESEYLINKVPSRLKDVLRFFIEAGMGTRAYAIIEQEKVGRLVDARPDERRLLLDEAAGVTRYKDQKKESERKLESASQNLSSLSAVLAEAKKQLSLVVKAAAKALKHQNLRAELKDLELALLARRHLELSLQGASLSGLSQEKRAALAALIARASQAEIEAENLKLRDNNLAQALEEEIAAFHQLDSLATQKNAEKERLADSRASQTERRAQVEAELSRVDSERERHEGEYARLQSLLETLAGENAEATDLARVTREEYLEAKGLADSLQAETRAVAQKYAETRESLSWRNETLAGTLSLAEHLSERRRSLELEKNESGHALAEAREKIASRARFKETLTNDLATAEEELSFLQDDEKEIRRQTEAQVLSVGALESSVAALDAKLETLQSLEESFSWYPRGVGELMREESLKERGLLGPVAAHLKIPAGYEKAAEAFLGERLSWLVARDRESALYALQWARERALGPARFFLLESFPEGDLTEGLLGNHVELEGPLSEEAIASLDPALSYLSPAGAYLSPALFALAATGEGAGEGEEKGLLLRLKEKEKAQEDLQEARETLRAAKESLSLAQENLAFAQESLAGKRSEKNNLAADLAQADSKLMVAVSEERGLSLRAGSLENEMARLEAELTACAAKKEETLKAKELIEAELETENARRLALEEKLAHAAAELDILKEKEIIATRDQNLAREKLESSARELRGVDGFLKSFQERKDSLARESAELALSLTTLEEKSAAIASEIFDFPARVAERQEKIDSLRAERASLKDALAQRETDLRGARQDREESQESLNALQKDLLENAFALASIKENLLKDWRVVFFDPDAPPPDPPDLDAPPRPDGAPPTRLNLFGEESPFAPESELAPEGVPPATADPLEGAIPEEGEGEGTAGAASPFPPLFGAETEASAQGPASPPPAVLPPARADGAGGDGAARDSGEGPEITFTDDPDLTPVYGGDINLSVPIARERPVEAGGERAPGPPPLSLEASPDPAPTAPAPPERVNPRDLQDKEIPENAAELIDALKERLRALGSVNLAAIAEEEELQKRYNFYRTQLEDLEKAIRDLKESVSRINQVCRERFAQTFEAADAQFREIFPVLFEGGEGWLSLADADDPLEAGVEIHVHPPGKKIMVMSLLSGGEKALTALALIFALYLIKPSPFCLLDEADAPLDEANIDRFNRLLRRLAESSQIVMVTHNKRTMQISDTLYGVTMETPGVSRLVSVNLSQAELISHV